MKCFTTEIKDFFHIGKNNKPNAQKGEKKTRRNRCQIIFFVYLQYGIASNFFVHISLDIIAACSQTDWLNQSWESNAC